MIFVTRCIMTSLLQQHWQPDVWPTWRIAPSRKNVFLDWKRELAFAITNRAGACGAECQSSQRHTGSLHLSTFLKKKKRWRKEAHNRMNNILFLTGHMLTFGVSLEVTVGKRRDHHLSHKVCDKISRHWAYWGYSKEMVPKTLFKVCVEGITMTLDPLCGFPMPLTESTGSAL